VKQNVELVKQNEELGNKQDEKIYNGSVQFYFDHGLPGIKKRKGLSSASPTSHHTSDESVVKFTEVKLKILSNIENYKKSAIDFASSISSKVIDGEKIEYVSESDVQGFVKDIIYDLLKASKLSGRCKCFNEIIFVKFRQVILVVVSEQMLPLCVIEVKKPTEKFDLVTDPKFLIQVSK
jgi:hypothetical protein